MSLKVRSFLAVALAMACFTIEAHAQSFSPYSDFQAMSVSQLSTLQVKLTYVVDVGPPTESVLFAGSQGSLNMSLFTPYRRPTVFYRSDDMAPDGFTVTTQELKAMIDSVASLSGVTDGNVDTGGLVAFTLSNTAGGTKIFESVVDSTNGRALFGKLLQVFGSDATARAALRGFGCGIGMLPRTAPSSVMSSTSVISSGLRLDRSSSQYVGKVKITNTSGSSISAPIILTMKSGADMSVTEAEGETCNIGDPNSFYLTVLGSGSLAPGANIEKTLHITNPGRVKLNVSFKVYAGAGTP